MALHDEMKFVEVSKPQSYHISLFRRLLSIKVNLMISILLCNSIYNCFANKIITEGQCKLQDLNTKIEEKNQQGGTMQ